MDITVHTIVFLSMVEKVSMFVNLKKLHFFLILGYIGQKKTVFITLIAEKYPFFHNAVRIQRYDYFETSTSWHPLLEFIWFTNRIAYFVEVSLFFNRPVLQKRKGNRYEKCTED